jgi:hypothetical protein
MHAQRLVQTFHDDSTALQWAVTAAFYCAVHCLEAHLATQNLHSRTHVQRERLAADSRNGVTRDVYAAYKLLKHRSEGARYFLWQFSAEAVERQILGQYLTTVTRFVHL